MTDSKLPPWEAAFRDRHVRADRRFLLKVATRLRWHCRDWFGRRMLVGSGVEIGAQYVPTKIDPRRASVEYVDAVSNEHLVRRYALAEKELVALAHVLEATNLEPYSAGSRDFLIAHHVLEHIDDPVGAVVEWLRILKSGGLLFLSVPNYRGNHYDFRRLPPNRGHLLLDRTDPAGRPARNLDHYREMARTMWDWSPGDPRVEQTARAWTEAGDRHHYHVFDESTLRDVLDLAARESGCRLDLDGYLLLDHGFEWLVLARKSPAGEAGAHWPSRTVSRPASLKVFTRTILSEAYRRLFARGRRR